MQHLSSRCSILSLLVALLLPISASAQRNVTVDDADTTAISYAPAGAWSRSENTPLNSGGSHTLTVNPAATAVFNFTGTAVYFLSPLWPYRVTTAISLDSTPPVLLDLVDHSVPDRGQGPETIASKVVWSRTGLQNGPHTVRVSVGSGEKYGIVDAFIYTEQNAISSGPSPSSSSSLTTTDRILAQPTTSSSPSTSSATSTQSPVPIALGVIFGLLGLGIFLFGIWFFCRKRKRPVSEAWTNAGTASARASSVTAPYPHPPPPGGYPMQQSPTGEWQNMHYGYVGTTPPPMFHQGYGQPPSYAMYGAHPYDPAMYGQQLHPGVPPNRAPNRYQPGYTLSTITEKSSVRTPMSHTSGLAPSPNSFNHSELGYFTASEIGGYSPASQGVGGYSPAHVAGQQQQAAGANGTIPLPMTTLSPVEEHNEKPSPETENPPPEPRRKIRHKKEPRYWN